MDSTLLLIALAVGGAVGLLTIHVYGQATRTERIVGARVRQETGDMSFAPGTILRTRRSHLPLVHLLPLSVEARDRMGRELRRAGWTIRVNEYLAIRLGSAAAACVVVLLVLNRVDLPVAAIEGLVVAAGTFVGWLIPRVLLSRAREKRRQRIEEQLPDALTSIAKSLRAGSGLLQALAYAANETPAPLGGELQSTMRDLQLGVDPDVAFADLSTRVESSDLNIAVTAISIQRNVGGNLSEILTNVTNTVRERANLYREVHVMTTRQRLTSNMVAAVPVLIAVFMMSLNPTMFELLTQTTPGRIGLGVGIGFELAGIWMIRKFATIEV